jgi:Tripartite tricarboxylate transporter TctB family
MDQPQESDVAASKGKFSQQAAGGVVLMAVAGLAIIGSRNLETGSLAEIGPGLFPRALAAFLMFTSALLLWRGWQPRTVPDSRFLTGRSLRAVVAILGAVLVFGLTIRGLGLLLATPIAILVSGFAGSDTRWVELSIFAVALTVFCSGLFRFALSLPIPLAPWLLGY